MKANMYRQYLQIFAAVSCFLKPGGITIAELAKELQVSRSTANRLKRSMEDELGYNFYNPREGQEGHEVHYAINTDYTTLAKDITSLYTFPVEDFLFSDEDKLYIELMFRTIGGFPSCRPQMQKLQDKMSLLLSLAGHVTGQPKGKFAERALQVPTMYTFQDIPKYADHDLSGVIIDLSRAVKDRNVCLVTYKAVGKEEKSYPIMPLVVFLYMGGFYTIVETVNHDYTSKLALERIEKLVVTDKTFVRKTKLDVMDMLSDPFGLAQGDQFEATVWLAPSLVPYIDCRDWPSDRVTIAKKEDGSALFHVITSGDFEFVRWIRYLGPEAVLLEPDWLVERVRKDLETACAQYAKKDPVK